jgi:hypothetical protein
MPVPLSVATSNLLQILVMMNEVGGPRALSTAIAFGTAWDFLRRYHC